MPRINCDYPRPKIHMGLHIERGEAGEGIVHPRRPYPVDAGPLLIEQPPPVDVERDVGKWGEFLEILGYQIPYAGLFEEELEAFPPAIQLVGRSSHAVYASSAA